MGKIKDIISVFDKNSFLEFYKHISFFDYLEKVYENPKLTRTAPQYIYDMIVSAGTHSFKEFRKTYTYYEFFDDVENSVYGLQTSSIQEIMNFLRGGSFFYGTEKRLLLLNGPVGSSKSTICRLIKRGLERYSKTEDGAWYTFGWKDIPPEIYLKDTIISPMNENPLKLLMPEVKLRFEKELNERHVSLNKDLPIYEIYPIRIIGELNPFDKFILTELMKKYEGDWEKVMNSHVFVMRRHHSESDRIGIGTFQPKDEKNQDSTELTGDLNYNKISKYGSDSDARAFNFDGEFCIANRGFLEFIEALKLANEFLYDLLGATQEKTIKPKKFSLVDIDEVIIAHTNTPELDKMVQNPFMDALKDRTYSVNVPYLTTWSDEIKILEKEFGPDKVRQHIMPHTLEIVALFGILTRLIPDASSNLNLVEKAKLYDKRELPGWTEDTIKELKDKHPEEGIKDGLSVRYSQTNISNCLVKYKDYVNVFMVLNELKDGLEKSLLIKQDKNLLSRYEQCIELVTKELDQILKAEVQKVLVADENAITRLCDKYIDNVMAYVNESKVVNPITGKEQSPDEKLMRSIEEKIEVSNKSIDSFRLEIAKFIGTLSHKKQSFRWDSNPKLKKALESKVFEDVKDHIKLSSLSSEASVVDEEITEKIDAIKARLKKLGYNDKSATDVLDYVSSIFARGDLAED